MDIAKGNIYNQLRKKMDAKGTNLTVVCQGANVNRDTVQKWKSKDPYTIGVIKRMVAFIDSLPEPSSEII